MQKTAYHHGDLRAALISAGLQLLAERDADELSLREAARAVGVSATAVYRHFPDKEAFLAALAHEGLDRLADAQHAAYEGASEGDRFDATGRAYVRFALENPALFRLVFTSGPAAGGEAQDVPEAMRFLRANVEERAGPGASGAEIWAKVVRAWATAHGLAMLMLDGKLPADPRLIEAVFREPREEEAC